MKNQVQSIQNCFTSWECKWNVGLYFGAQETLFRGFADVDCGALFTARFKTTQDPRLHNLQKFITLLNRPSAVYMGCMWSPKWKNCKNMDLCQVEDCQPPASTWPPKGYTGLFSTLYGPLLDIYTPREEWKPCFFLQYSFRPRGGRRVGGSSVATSSPSVRLGALLSTMFSTAVTVTVAHVLYYCSTVCVYQSHSFY